METSRGSKNRRVGAGWSKTGGPGEGVRGEVDGAPAASGRRKRGSNGDADIVEGLAADQKAGCGNEGDVRHLRMAGLSATSAEGPRFDGCICYCPLTNEMTFMENELQLVLVGSLSGPRMCIGSDDIAKAIEANIGVPVTSLKILYAGPALFLIKCPCTELMTQLLVAKNIKGNGFSVELKRWSREEGSTEFNLSVKVEIKMTGLPAHAWNEKYVRSVLEEHCWVEAVRMSGFLEGNMASVVVDAWAASVESIPLEKKLAIPEPLVGSMLEITSLVTPPWAVRKLRKYPISLETDVIAYSPLSDLSPDRFGSDSGNDGCPTDPFCVSSSSRGYESVDEVDSDREPYGWKHGDS